MKVTLLESEVQSSLIEAMQSNGVKFAFANPTNDESKFQLVHSWVKCREYFNEFLMKNYHLKDFKMVPVFGFKYDYEKYPLDLSATRIGIKFPNQVTCDSFKNNLKVLHRIEDINGVDKTVVHETDDPLIIFIVGSKLWIQKCLLLNLYTLTIKLLSLGMGTNSLESLLALRKTAGNLTEINYINRISPQSYNALMENCTSIASTPTKYVDGTEELRGAGQVHEHSGILAIKNDILAERSTFNVLLNVVKDFFIKPQPKNDFFEVVA